MADDSVEAYGVNCHHDSITVGGWHRPGGDDGSAIAIAHKAVNACCREMDGVGASTQILPMLLRHLEVLDLRHFLDRCKDGMLSLADIAAVNEIVNSAAVQGDAIARALLRDAGKDLGSLAASLLNRLKMESTMPAVGTVGSVFRSGRLVLKSFRETVHKAVPHCKIVGQQAPVCVGAAISALEEIGVEMQENMVNAMRASLPRLSAVRVS
jgi:N-acetylglucosamine kinase-like BadF-type ATPase